MEMEWEWDGGRGKQVYVSVRWMDGKREIGDRENK